MKVMDGYFGGKGAEGVYQRIINQIPEHEVFWSGFLGNCAVMRYKRPAARNFGTDLDLRVIAEWYEAMAAQPQDSPFNTNKFTIRNLSAIDILQTWNSHDWINGNCFAYFDPPYMDEVKTSERRYKYHIRDRHDHIQFLHLATQIPAMVAISHYPCDLYGEYLQDWRCIEYLAATRGGPRKECLWMNYPEPNRLHDYRYLGKNFREREKFKRRADTLVRKLLRMGDQERKAALGRIIETFEI